MAGERRILITGGAVPVYIDDMRILSNGAKGGQSAEYADIFARKGYTVTYLTAQAAILPKEKRVNVVYYNGFDDYREKVIAISKESDLVVLSAAVANFMRKGGRYKGKINPNAEGELVLRLVPTPKVINEVKKVNPGCCLVGFKLMSRASRDELIDGAWKVMRNARADLVIANDRQELMRKLILAKDKSFREVGNLEGAADFIEQIANDKHFRTKVSGGSLSKHAAVAKACQDLAERNSRKFVSWGDGSERRFGCIAMRSNGGMVISPREKDTPKTKWKWVLVRDVDPRGMRIHAAGGKASLNTPLLWNVFRKNRDAAYIIHYHRQRKGLPTVGWAPPGTLREYNLARKGSFNVFGHGAIEIYDKKGDLLVE
ncbi:MAG: phosphopantothenoylcysteine decarboxylase [Candidatus Micrarchaeales archaeon]|nr:phosphopantothenoylcysteine decarboxylase [Candidatus Micrarchaeales archaeon]